MRPDPETLLRWIKPETTPWELECMTLLQPGDYEIYSAKLDQILLEARETFIRMGVSGMIRSGDLAVGLYTAGGDMACTSSGTFMHVLATQLPIKFIVHNYLHDPTVGVREGDIFYFNDAIYGGFHNPDQMAIMPIICDGKLLAWSAAIAHQPETGGVVPGGQPITTKTKYEEGMRIPPIRIGENYQLRSDLLEMFTNFIDRAPRMQELDMRARAAGCDRVRIRVQELAREKGNDFLVGLLRRMIMLGEEAARKRIKEWNDGTYRAVNFGDTLGREEGLYRFFLTLRKEDDRLLFDFSGTSPEHDVGSYHCPAHAQPGWVALILYCYYFHDLPVSCGPFAAMEFIVPPGTLLNPSHDAAVANAPPLGAQTIAPLSICFAKMIFDSPLRERIVAPWNTSAAVVISGSNQYGDRVSDILSYPMNTSGQGARINRDGIDSHGFYLAPPTRAPDFDEVEGERPIIHLLGKQLKDSCGWGRYRSGVGTVQAFMVHDVPQLLYYTTGRESRIHNSVGLFGGYPAGAKFGLEIRNSDIWRRMRQGDRDIPLDYHHMVSKRTIKGEYRFEANMRAARLVYPGDIWCNMVGGTGGYGDVLERDPELVMKDIRDEIISHRTAEDIYKVAYDPDTLEVDRQKTEELRQREREQRIRRGKPFAQFVQEWSRKKPPEAILKHYGSWPDARKVREVVRT